MVAAAQPARRLSSAGLLGDAALAIAVFALSLGLLAAGGTDHAGALGVPEVLLTALASLPLVARRASPLGVFVLMGVASAVSNTTGTSTVLAWSLLLAASSPSDSANTATASAASPSRPERDNRRAGCAAATINQRA